MKIHIITNSFSNKLGGAEKLINLIHSNLIKNNIDSYVIALLKVDENKSITKKSLGVNTPYDFRILFYLKSYIQNNVSNDDIIHSHLFPTNLYCAILKKMGYLNSILITTEHSTYNRRRKIFFGKYLDNFIYKTYDHVIAVSEGVKITLKEWQPQINNRITVIHNGCQLQYNHPILRHKKNNIIIISIGQLLKHKNYHIALESLALIKNHNFKWLIAGDGPLKNQLINKRDRLGLKNKVEFLGQIDNIAPLLEKGDIFLMPSLWEGFGLAAVEAMNASLPLVASNIHGLKEIVETIPPCALLIDPNEPQLISQNINKLMKSHKLRLNLGLNGFKHSKKFKIDTMVKNHINLYKKISI